MEESVANVEYEFEETEYYMLSKPEATGETPTERSLEEMEYDGYEVLAESLEGMAEELVVAEVEYEISEPEELTVEVQEETSEEVAEKLLVIEEVNSYVLPEVPEDVDKHRASFPETVAANSDSLKLPPNPILNPIISCHQCNSLISSVRCISNMLDSSESSATLSAKATVQTALYRQGEWIEFVLSARGEVAARYLDVIQEMLDSQRLPQNDVLSDSGYCEDPELIDIIPPPAHHTDHYYCLRRLLLKLSTASDILPPSLFLTGVLCQQRESIGGGAFADIYIGSYHDEDVALKRLRIFANNSKSQNEFKNFSKEVLIWRQLCHPNIHPFLGIDNITFSPYRCMVSPWMPHGNILDCINKWSSSLHDDPDAKPEPLYFLQDKWLRGITQGLEYLHGQQVIHGDLRGSNILLDENYDARLTDFGLTVTVEITSCGSHFGGATRWMAPELLDPWMFNKEHCWPTFSSDIYAFACVCIEIYTGQPPFADIPYSAQVARLVLGGERPSRPSSESSFGRAVSDDLWTFLQTCWDQEAACRPSAVGTTAFLVP